MGRKRRPPLFAVLFVWCDETDPTPLHSTLHVLNRSAVCRYWVHTILDGTQWAVPFNIDDFKRQEIDRQASFSDSYWFLLTSRLDIRRCVGCGVTVVGPTSSYRRDDEFYNQIKLRVFGPILPSQTRHIVGCPPVCYEGYIRCP